MEEVEAKYRLDDAGAQERLRARLAAAGARQGGIEQERNVLFDYPDERLRHGDQVLRLRILDGGPVGRLTYKGPAAYEGAVKRRTELEVAVDDCEVMQALLLALGYAPRIEYPKQRETWYLDGAEVAIDTLPFGTYCEIEGPATVVPRLAAALALAPEAAERTGYPGLMARYLQRGGAPAP